MLIGYARQNLANPARKLRDLANPARKLQDLANPARKPNSKHFLWAPWGAP